MARCEQCGADFSNWFGDVKRICPECQQRARSQANHQNLPADAAAQPAPKLGLPRPIVTQILIGINVAVYLAMLITSRQFLAFDSHTRLLWGANFSLLTAGGEWWRMLTSTFVHGMSLHIAVNMWALLNLGYTAEVFYGRKNFLIIYLLSGLAGSAGTILWSPMSVSVGASGAIFGVAGALAALVYFKKLPVDRKVLRRDFGSIGIMIIFNLALGAKLPFIDNAAHVGGLVAGFVLALALPARIFRVEREKSKIPGYLASAGVFAVIVVVALLTRAKLAPDIEVYRASVAYDAGDKPAAYAHVERAVALHPKSLYSNFLIGAFYLETGENDKAKPFLERASELDPNDEAVKRALDHARNAQK
jgi:membrane associated rhomboid family serine protease